MVETHRVKDLANKVSQLTNAKITYLKNPRNEAAENDLHVKNDCFLSDGLLPTTLDEGLLEEVIEIAEKFKSRADTTKILCKSNWTNA